jgi:hypothetical protein
MDLHCYENPKSKMTNSITYTYHSLKNDHQEIMGPTGYIQKNKTHHQQNTPTSKLGNNMHL